jgi:hypothetical protein
MSVRLRPSSVRTAGTLLLAVGGVMAATAAAATNEHWWSRAVTLLVPVAICFVAVSFMFVPIRLKFTDRDFTIQYLLGRAHTLSWDDLEYYGPRNNVFMIQFSGRQAFQIFDAAFSRKQWFQLASFLSTQFPTARRMVRWAEVYSSGAKNRPPSDDHMTTTTDH